MIAHPPQRLALAATLQQRPPVLGNPAIGAQFIRGTTRFTQQHKSPGDTFSQQQRWREDEQRPPAQTFEQQQVAVALLVERFVRAEP